MTKDGTPKGHVYLNAYLRRAGDWMWSYVNHGQLQHEKSIRGSRIREGTLWSRGMPQRRGWTSSGWHLAAFWLVQRRTNTLAESSWYLCHDDGCHLVPSALHHQSWPCLPRPMLLHGGRQDCQYANRSVWDYDRFPDANRSYASLQIRGFLNCFSNIAEKFFHNPATFRGTLRHLTKPRTL